VNELAIFPLLVWLVGIALTILVLHTLIRSAVGRGLRDHQLWMEANRPQTPPEQP
jgi:hypothetical protein